MEAERHPLRRWAYRGMHLAIVAGGLAAIVGSGGAGFPAFPEWEVSNEPYLSVEVRPYTATVQVGHDATFRAFVSGTALSGTPSYSWCRQAPGTSICVPIPGANGPTYTVTSANLADDQAVYLVSASSGGKSDLDSGLLMVSSAPGVVFQDTEFLEADWQSSGFDSQRAPSSAFSVSRASTAGNPGAHRVVEYGPAPPAEHVAHTAQAAIYDPGQQGSIYAIDFNVDCLAISAPEGAEPNVRPMLRQGARIYYGPLQVCGTNAWSSYSTRPGGSLLRFAFAIFHGPACGAGESCPDFSAAGAPITFGALTRRGLSSWEGVSQALDNWRVTVWRR